MKKIFFIAASALALVSCGSMARTVTTATYNKCATQVAVTNTLADLNVSETKISYYYATTSTVRAAGFDNALNTAISEALINEGGNADVLVGLQYQAKYNSKGEVQSIFVSGYPATYVNFRVVPDSVLVIEKPAASPLSLGGLLKKK